MARTRLSVIAAGLLAAVAAAVCLARHAAVDNPLDRDDRAQFGSSSSTAVPPRASAAQSFWRAISLARLPPAEQQYVGFLLLLPVAALVVSVCRVVIGVPTYGMFAPALLGLIFRDLRALPWGLGAFVLTVLVGWELRRLLDRFHLLLIPRAGALLTLIVLFLLMLVVAAARYGITVTGYVALFPLIILTHLVERFWTIEAEDGTVASFKTLLGTVVVVAAVSLTLSFVQIERWLFRHPEGLLVVVAAQLLLGRYTGYRLMELSRFRDLVEFEEADSKGLDSEAGNQESRVNNGRRLFSPGGAAPYQPRAQPWGSE